MLSTEPRQARPEKGKRFVMTGKRFPIKAETYRRISDGPTFEPAPPSTDFDMAEVLRVQIARIVVEIENLADKMEFAVEDEIDQIVRSIQTKRETIQRFEERLEDLMNGGAA
jgi:hypothetical protein